MALNVLSIPESIHSEKKFAVIGFIDDNSVEIIPCKWLVSDVEAKWPPPTTATSILQRLISDCCDAKYSWKSFKIKIYSKTDCYLKATRKLNIARELSSVSSDLSDSESKLIQPRINTPEQPLINFSNQSQIHYSKTQKRKRKIPVRYTDYSLDECLESNESASSPSSESEPSSSESISDEEVVLKRVGKKYRISQLHSKSDSSSRANKTKRKKPSEMLEIKSILLKVLNLQKKSYTKLKSLEKQYDKLEEELSSLKNLSHKRSGMSTIGTLPVLPENLILPLESDQQLLMLNSQIASDPDLRNKLIRFFLQTVLGRSESSFLIAVMRTLLTKDVAMTYSRLGRKGKKSFVSLGNIYNVLLTTASMKFPNSTPEKLAEVLGKVLSQSSDWDGRKKSGDDSNDTLCIEL